MILRARSDASLTTQTAFVVDSIARTNRWAGLNQTLKVLECELPVRDSSRLQEAYSKKESGSLEVDSLLLVRALSGGSENEPTKMTVDSPTAAPLVRKKVDKLPALSPSSPARNDGNREASPVAESSPSPIYNQTSSASVYSEITEEIEEVLSFVDEGENSVVDVGGPESSLQPMDSTTLDVVNSTLSASDHSGEMDSDVEGIEAADF